MAQLNAGDTAWLLMATALVMIMLPGLALFYGGLVRRKNVLSTIMHSFFGLALVSVVWVLSVSASPSGLTCAAGAHRRARFRRLHERRPGAQPGLCRHHPVRAVRFVPAHVRGHHARADHAAPSPSASASARSCCSRSCGRSSSTRRSRTGSGRRAAGCASSARSTSPAAPSSISPRACRALVAAIVIGRAATGRGRDTAPHDVPMTVLGAGLLWFGWFGFNAGSALAANGQAANALLVTNIGGRGRNADLGPRLVCARQGRVVGAAAGAVAGLVAITPAQPATSRPVARCSSASPPAACATAPRCYASALRIDDALDVFAVHGVGGMFGAVATGVLAVAAIGGVSGAIQGNFAQVGIQLVAVGATVISRPSARSSSSRSIEFVLGLRVEPQAGAAGPRPGPPRRGRLPVMSA